MKKIKGICLIAVALLVSTCTNVGIGIGSEETSSAPPVVVVIVSPEEGMTYESTEIALVVTTEGDIPYLNWSYRLNEGENISFSPAGYANESDNGSARTTLTASEGANMLDVYVEEREGDTGKATVSFIVNMSTSEIKAETNQTAPELSELSQEEGEISAKKKIEVEVKANAPITNLNDQENCTVNVSLAGNETVNESAKMRIAMRSGDANVVHVLVENSTENVGNTALFFVTVPEGGMSNGNAIQLEVHANDLLMNWSDWMNMSDIFSFEGNGRVRLTANASDLVKMFAGDSGGNAVNATISFIEGTNSSEIKVETASTTSGLTVLPTDVWMSSEKDIVLEVNADELLSAWSQWGKVYENFSYTGNGSMRLSANTSDLVKIFVGGGAGDNAKTTISLIMDTSAPGIRVETDTTAPEITLLSPEAGAIYAARVITLEVKADEPVSNWSYRLSGKESIAVESVNGSVKLALTADEGTNTVEIYAVDGVGNTGTSVVSFSVDTTPPEITILSPEKGKTYAVKEITLEVKADEPVSNWSYRLNGGEIIAVESVSGSVKLTLTVDEGTNTVEIYAVDGVGNTGKSVVSFAVDTTPPIITVLSPETGKIYTTRVITLEVKADEPISNWSYRLNGGESITFTQGGLGNGSRNETAIISLIARVNSNIVEIYAEDSVGNMVKTVVSFVVMEPRIMGELLVEGVGYISIDKEMTTRVVALEAEERIEGITGPDGAYTIDLLEILSGSVNPTDPRCPNYHHAASISFSGNDYDSDEAYSSPISQGGIGATLTEKNDVTELQKQGTVSIKTTSAEGCKQSFNTETAAAFTGRKETEIEWSTPTKEVALSQMLDGNCTAQMELTFTE
ncbi:hypothetical protein C5S31_11060 [ANME-1 cluster archaeon GoMg2]|nr:hypothetical protein [ANME-1 cluster archaeon GoMg2]